MNIYFILYFKGYDDAASIVTASDGSLLVAFFDGCNIMRTWNLETRGAPMIREIHLTESEESSERGIHKDNSIVVAANSFGAQVNNKLFI